MEEQKEMLAQQLSVVETQLARARSSTKLGIEEEAAARGAELDTVTGNAEQLAKDLVSVKSEHAMLEKRVEALQGELARKTEDATTARFETERLAEVKAALESERTE